MTDISAPDPAEVTGLILAGGAGRRAGGVDKGLIDWQGEPLVAHVARRMRPQCATLIISCNRNEDRYAQFGATVMDTLDGYQGPLAGLHAAAGHIVTPLTLICPCDVPRVPGDLVAVLAPKVVGAGLSAAYAKTDDRRHFCCALLRTDCLETLQPFLADGRRAVREWLQEVGGVAVEFTGREAEFRNLNTPGQG